MIKDKTLTLWRGALCSLDDNRTSAKLSQDVKDSIKCFSSCLSIGVT